MKIYIKHSWQCLTTFPNTSKNTPPRVVIPTLFSVFGNVVKHGLPCLIYYILKIITPTATTRVFLSSSVGVVSRIVLVISSGVLSISTCLPQKVYKQTHQKAHELAQGLNRSACKISTNKTRLFRQFHNNFLISYRQNLIRHSWVFIQCGGSVT